MSHIRTCLGLKEQLWSERFRLAVTYSTDLAPNHFVTMQYLYFSICLHEHLVTHEDEVGSSLLVSLFLTGQSSQCRSRGAMLSAFNGPDVWGPFICSSKYYFSLLFCSLESYSFVSCQLNQTKYYHLAIDSLLEIYTISWYLQLKTCWYVRCIYT